MFKNRLHALDSLRGLAAIAVLIFHYEGIIFINTDGKDLFPAASSQYTHLALLGVELFFIISGFVILMSAERAKSAASFLRDRAARIYPAYLVSVVPAALAVLAVKGLSEGFLSKFTINITMLQTFFGFDGLISPYWTLAYEIWFYALIAVVIQLKLMNRIALICFSWLIFTVAMKFLLSSEFIEAGQIVRLLTLFHFGNFFVIGIMIYLISTKRTSVLVLACLIVATILTSRGRWDWAEIRGVHYISATIGFEIIVLLAANVPSRFLSHPALVWLGQRSYSLYLLHMPVGLLLWVACHRADLSPVIGIIVSVPLTIWLASLSRQMIEVPGQALLRGDYQGITFNPGRLKRSH